MTSPLFKYRRQPNNTRVLRVTVTAYVDEADVAGILAHEGRDPEALTPAKVRESVRQYIWGNGHPVNGVDLEWEDPISAMHEELPAFKEALENLD